MRLHAKKQDDILINILSERNKNDMSADSFGSIDKNDKKSFLSGLLGVYVILIGFGLPLAVRDRYYDILVFKYYYFSFCTIAMILLLTLYSVTVGFKGTVSKIRNIRVSELVKKLTAADRFILLYLFIAAVSTVTSDYVYESFWGNEGRYTGLFLITWYILSYFCVSRLWKFKNWYVDLILLSGVLVCAFGITDYFNMDILHFKEHMLPVEKPMFTSSLGNINTYTAYVGMITAIASVLFGTEKRQKYIIWYYFCVVVCFFAIIMGVSDNAYLSLAALFGALPLYLFNTKKGIRRYLIIITTFLTVAQCIGWINVVFGDRVLGIDSAFNLVMEFRGLPYLVLLLWIGIAIWYIIDIKRKTQEKNFGNVFRYIWLGLMVMILLLISYFFYDSNVAGHADKYSSLSNYLVFNDDWGTHRGYIWRNAMECYFNLPMLKKIIGYGPETFGILLLKKTAGNPYNQIFDSAHNEYLHVLITVGIAGLIAYVGFLLAFIKRSITKQKNSPYIMALVFGVICYCAQATVNINLPIVAPFLWLFIGMVTSTILEKQE